MAKRAGQDEAAADPASGAAGRASTKRHEPVQRAARGDEQPRHNGRDRENSRIDRPRAAVVLSAHGFIPFMLRWIDLGIPAQPRA